MKIDGIDPLVLNRIKDQTTRPEVRETERSDTENRIKQRNRLLEQKAAAGQEKSMLEDLEESVKKLNDTANAFQLSLRFQMHQESERWMVQVIDVVQDEIIREIPPEQVLNVVAQIQDLIGILLDARR